jgi:hypothetical protein
MTLDTRIYVVDEIDLRELFTKCQALLTPYDDQHRTPEQQQSKLHPESLDNEPMQGLPAWLMVYTGGERPYRTAEQAVAHEYCNHPDSPHAKYYGPGDPVCTETEHDPPCWYEVSYDTAYGYRGPDGIGCGDLHARLVAELGASLDAKGIRWKWRNEFNSNVYEGYDQLIELASGGFEATAWFQTTVLPAIAARTAGGAS